MDKIRELMDMDNRDIEVLEVLTEGRANPFLIRERTDMGKGEVNTILNRLGRHGYLKQVTRGLYEITDDGREMLDN